VPLAAESATRDLNADFITVILKGRYTDDYLKGTGEDAPQFTDDELKTIATPLDFVGINSYRPNIYVVPSDEPPGYRSIPINASHPKMQSEWHLFDPALHLLGTPSRAVALGRDVDLYHRERAFRCTAISSGALRTTSSGSTALATGSA